jgi:hypothetical protein
MPGHLLWLELEEFDSRPKIAVLVIATYPRARRAHVDLLGSVRGPAVSVDYARLFEMAEP